MNSSDLLLDDVRRGRVRKANFSGLIYSEEVAEKFLKALRQGKYTTKLNISRCVLGK